jgi:AraC-like DNA-binding protein
MSERQGRPRTTGPSTASMKTGSGASNGHGALEEGAAPLEQARLGDAGADADSALETAQARWRAGDLEAATRHIERALGVLERAGLRHRLGAAYKLHAMAFISRDKASLALAAATRALGYPDVGASDRMYLYATVAMALHSLIDLPTGGQVMLEQSWPEAQRAGDAKTLVDCASRCAGLLHDCACWALQIPNLSLVGIEAPAPESGAAYLQQAGYFIDICDAHADAISAPDRSWYLAQKGCVLNLTQGFDAVLPIFLEAQQLAVGHPRQAMMADMTTGIAARIAGRWKTARKYLLRSRAREAAQSEHTRRFIAWELSHVYHALGASAEAVNELRTFEVLQARKSRLAEEWITDAANQRRYGNRFDVAVAREALVGRMSPVAVTRATQYIEDHIAERLTLDDVAKHANVGKRTLQNLFRDHRGVALGEFIRERRMQRADQELRSGLRRIAEVAERSGYSNAANFARDYRKRFGQSPSSAHRVAHGVARRPQG